MVCEDEHYCYGVIVEYGRYIFARELVRCVADEQARLTDSTVANNDTSAKSALFQFGTAYFIPPFFSLLLVSFMLCVDVPRCLSYIHFAAEFSPECPLTL